MKGILFNLSGNWGHFRKPETNNNPLTHDFITKTALIGLIGSVLGIERRDMAQLFPKLSEGLLYGVRINKAVRKESWAFTLRYAVDMLQKAPKQMEFLKNPQFTVAVALRDEQMNETFSAFVAAIKDDVARFTPVLGLHNCPAEIVFMFEGSFELKEGAFTTKSFIREGQLDTSRLLQSSFRLGVEKIPTFQNDDFWNLPDKYERVLYPSEEMDVYGSGEHYEFSDGSKWVLI